MPGKKLVVHPVDTIYLYDGSLAGFYCCVYESVYGRELPAAIHTEDTCEPTLFTLKEIQTDSSRAEKVRNSIPRQISPRALELVENIYLTCLKEKERHMLLFLLLGYDRGPSVTEMLGHRHVAPLLKAERHMLHEAHLYTGFIRFSDNNGVLVSEISPKNFVLPYIMEHFSARFSQESFLIYDKTNKHALVYQNYRSRIIYLEDFQMAGPSETEHFFRSLWKQFYSTIGIEERYNPKCRMTNMPKRYWQDMTEMKELL